MYMTLTLRNNTPYRGFANSLLVETVDLSERVLFPKNNIKIAAQKQFFVFA
jgi:hypothetical protein